MPISKHPSVVRVEIFRPEQIEQAADDTPIWRYVPLATFEPRVLRSKSLYFCNVQHFEDSAEATFPSSVWDFTGSELREWHRNQRRDSFVNCWHLNPIESALMWKAYGGQNKAVVLASTVGRLIKQLERRPDDRFAVGMVRYVDYRQEHIRQTPLSNLYYAFTKRRYYADEREFRAAFMLASPSVGTAVSGNDNGILVPVNLNDLLTGVRVAPNSTDSQQTAVRQMLDSNDIGVQVVRSSLDEFLHHVFPESQSAP